MSTNSNRRVRSIGAPLGINAGLMNAISRQGSSNAIEESALGHSMCGRQRDESWAPYLCRGVSVRLDAGRPKFAAGWLHHASSRRPEQVRTTSNQFQQTVFHEAREVKVVLCGRMDDGGWSREKSGVHFATSLFGAGWTEVSGYVLGSWLVPCP